MPLDKLYMYSEGARRKRARIRKDTFADTVNAIGVSFSGKGFEKYLDSIGE